MKWEEHNKSRSLTPKEAGKLIKSKSSTETLKPVACGSPSAAFLDVTSGVLD